MKAKKLPSGNWNCQVYIGMDSNGKKIVESVTAPTKKEAEYKASELKLKRQRKDKMTLREAFTRYCDSRRNTLSASTMREYDRFTRTCASPLMDRDIREITTDDAQRFVDDMARRYAPKTVRNRYGMFSSVMAVYQPLVKYKVTLPKFVDEDVYIPEPSTIRRLAAILRERESWLYVPFLLASQCGLRASEIAGLQYKHIRGNVIDIRQAKVAGSEGPVVKTTKTKAGKRTVRAGDYVIEQLGKGKPDQFVVDHSAWMISDAWGDFMRTLTDEEYFSFHKLRHYFASNALLLGVPKKYVAVMMGHKGDQMLDKIYAHTFKTPQASFEEQIAASSDNFFR